MTHLAQASRELEQVREWLLRPSAETVDACGPALERAAAELAALVQDPPPGPDPTLAKAAAELAREVIHTQALLAAAGELYYGRLRHLNEAASL